MLLSDCHRESLLRNFDEMIKVRPHHRLRHQSMLFGLTQSSFCIEVVYRKHHCSGLQCWRRALQWVIENDCEV